MYGDSYGSPGQDSAFDPSTPTTDVKVAGTPAAEGGGWSEPEVGEMRAPRRGDRRPMKIAIIAAAAVVVVGGGATAVLALSGGDAKSGTNAAALPTTAASGSQSTAPPGTNPQLQAQADENAHNHALSRASKAASGFAKKAPPVMAKGAEPTPSTSAGSVPAPGSDPTPVGAAQSYAKGLLSGYGWSSNNFGCLVDLWNKESHWNAHAGTPTGPYGIPQSNPGTKMASAGSDWENNYKTQIKWGLGYIKSRWTSPCGAWSHSQATGWY